MDVYQAFGKYIMTFSSWWYPLAIVFGAWAVGFLEGYLSARWHWKTLYEAVVLKKDDTSPK
jgi:hypothetical protein